MESRPVNAMTAHPRSRGEHPGRYRCTRARRGSSPLARGTQPQPHQQRLRRRLIPARAGNTEAALPCGLPPPAHPRSRGEHSSMPRMMTRAPGSSPLARGTHRFGVQELQSKRLIPARAGNTSTPPLRWSVISAHPRSRGEHSGSASVPAGSIGSSPLARGTLLCGTIPNSTFRLIPARAGNTSTAPSPSNPPSAHPRSRGEHLPRRTM